MQYSGVQSLSATGILNGLLRRQESVRVILQTPSHSGGYRERKIACYSSSDAGISRCASQRSAAVQVLVAGHGCAADNRGLFWAVLAHGHAVMRALSHSDSGVGCRAIDIGIQAGSDRVP